MNTLMKETMNAMQPLTRANAMTAVSPMNRAPTRVDVMIDPIPADGLPQLFRLTAITLALTTAALLAGCASTGSAGNASAARPATPAPIARPVVGGPTTTAEAAKAAAARAGASAQTGTSATVGGTLQPQASRISDEAVTRDTGVYRATQERIAKLNATGKRPVADYHLAKAQCWLDTSFHEYTRNDRGGYPQAALTESQRLISAMENGTDPGWQTPLVNHAQKLRDDLWARYDALRGHGGFSCAAQKTACAEVELVHAGNEIRQGGWRNAKPYIQIAEDLVGEAEAAARACGTAVAAAPVPAPASAPAAAPIAAAPVTERIELGADALFRFDRHERGQIVPDGADKVRALAQRIAEGFVRIDSMTVVGHTDRLGSVAYNDRLSLQRAQTVKAMLEQGGVKAPIAAYGMGKREPVRSCADSLARPALIDCLQANRRVVIEVVGVRRP